MNHNKSKYKQRKRKNNLLTFFRFYKPTPTVVFEVNSYDVDSYLLLYAKESNYDLMTWLQCGATKYYKNNDTEFLPMTFLGTVEF